MGKPRQLEFIGKVPKRELQRETTSVESPPKSQVFQLSTDPQCARPEREPPERRREQPPQLVKARNSSSSYYQKTSSFKRQWVKKSTHKGITLLLG